jgi:prevent-host-death family protein
MKVYTYSEARQRLARVLDEARREGTVHIRRRGGELFVLQPARAARSPLDVRGVKANLRPGELLDIMREIREGRRPIRRAARRSRKSSGRKR